MGTIKRTFDIGFKRQLVEQILSGSITTAEAAREYSLSRGLIDRWIGRYESGKLVEKPSSEEKRLRAENERLKAKIGELTMDIDLLKKLADYARRKRSEDMSVITAKNLEALRGGAK